MNGEDTSSSSSEEEKEADAAPPVNKPSLKSKWTPVLQSKEPANGEKTAEEDDEEEEGSCLPTIVFSHTVEPKKVRVIIDYCILCPLLLTVQFNQRVQLNRLYQPLCFASGEDQHREKHNVEVQ